MPYHAIRIVAVVLTVGFVAGAGLAAHQPPPWHRPHVIGSGDSVYEANTAGTYPHNNVNGPFGQETRAIPQDARIHPSFHGLADRLSGPDPAPSGPGVFILDHQMYGSAMYWGNPVRYEDALARGVNHPATAPTSMHFAWFGWWEDKNGDGVIDDVVCDSPASLCGLTDEFLWRGEASGETFHGKGWIFPGDYDPSAGPDARVWPYDQSRPGHRELLSGLSPDCTRHNSGGGNPGCVNPEPDFDYTDRTVDPNLPGWVAGYGGGQLTAEEFLLVSQHVVSTFRSTAAVAPNCADCLRDYDWYDSVASDTVEGLYLTTVRCVADAPPLRAIPPCGVEATVSWPRVADVCRNGTVLPAIPTCAAGGEDGLA